MKLQPPDPGFHEIPHVYRCVTPAAARAPPRRRRRFGRRPRRLQRAQSQPQVGAVRAAAALEDVTLGEFCATLRGDPRAGYLKQCPLEDLGCRWALRAHAPFLQETTSWVQETAFLWVGGANATTGLHSDDEDNVLLVTHGSKHVLLYPPTARRHEAAA